VFLIGVDAATLDLIRPWADSGRLPTFQMLMRSGVCGNLVSVIPPETPPAWTSLVTGKNPGKHGVLDFLVRREPGAPKTVVNTTDRHSRAIWNILSDDGKTCGMLTVPVTYPPEKVNGFMISGFLTPPDKTDTTYPPGLRDEIVQRLGVCRSHSDRFNLT